MQINEKVSTDEYETTNTEMSVALAPVAAAVSENVQAGLPKNMVPDPGWFDSDRSKFEDWWRVSQIRYSLVVILELNGVSEVQYKDMMMISINKNN